MSVQEGLGEATFMRAAGLGVSFDLESIAPSATELIPEILPIEITPGELGPAGLRSGALAGAIGEQFIAALGIVQAALRHPLSVALDAVAALAAVDVVTGSLRAEVLTVSVFVAAGMTFGLWKVRSSVEAFGVSWYMKSVVAPLVATGCCATAAGVMSITSSEEWALVAFGLLAGFHLFTWLALAFSRRSKRDLIPTLIIGCPADTEAISRRLAVYPEMGLSVRGTCDPTKDLIAGAPGQEQIERLLNTWAPAHVMCVDSDSTRELFKDLVAFAQGRVDLTLVIPATRMTSAARRLGDVGLIPVKTRRSWGSAAATRAFEVVVASLAILVSAPLLLATAVAIRLEDGGPVIFKQRRPGLDGAPFDIYKFRSMISAPTPSGEYLSKLEVGSLTFKVRQDPRVTRVGRLIRRLSIDELPQLFNVVKGDMSLVGPRPLAFDPDEYEGRARLRHSVRPGITGLWQVSGANALDDSDMIELDLSYVAHRSLGMDLLLLLRTASAVVVRRAPV